MKPQVRNNQISNIFRSIGTKKSPGLFMNPNTYTATLITRRRVQKVTKEAVCQENVPRRLLLPRLLYVRMADTIVTKETLIATTT